MAKKALWVLDIDHYIPELTRVTTAAFKAYAHRIHADFNVIRQRKFPDWHVTYEKAQVYCDGRDYDWNMVMDTDLLLHPEFPDLTERVPDFSVGLKDAYPANARFLLNSYFFRDRRKVGVCGVFAMASKHCFDLWTPLPGVQADHLGNIHPLPDEIARGVAPEHFITEYWLSYNLARFGLQFTGILHEDEQWMFHHPYGDDSGEKFRSFTKEEKLRGVLEKSRHWGISPDGA